MRDTDCERLKTGIMGPIELMSGDFPKQIGFKKMMKDRKEVRQGIELKVDLKKVAGGMAKAPYGDGSASGKGRTAFIVGEALCFMAPSDQVRLSNLSAIASAQFHGAKCDVVIRRLPLDLFGGVMTVPAQAIDLQGGIHEIKTLLEKEWSRAPEQLLAEFHFNNAKERGALNGSGSPEDPYTIRADMHLPPMRVMPTNQTPSDAGGGAVVVNWTNDMRWCNKEAYAPLTVRQTILQTVGKGTSSTLAPYPYGKDCDNKTGKPGEGFYFNWGSGRDGNLSFSLPGDYVLRYTLQPFRDPYVKKEDVFSHHRHVTYVTHVTSQARNVCNVSNERTSSRTTGRRGARCGARRSSFGDSRARGNAGSAPTRSTST